MSHCISCTIPAPYPHYPCNIPPLSLHHTPPSLYHIPRHPSTIASPSLHNHLTISNRTHHPFTIPHRVLHHTLIATPYPIPLPPPIPLRPLPLNTPPPYSGRTTISATPGSQVTFRKRKEVVRGELHCFCAQLTRAPGKAAVGWGVISSGAIITGS